jgi:integrase
VSVRKRSWIAPNGERKEAWVVDYRDQHGDRHIKTFARKKDADAYHAKVAVDVRAGVHTPDSQSVTIAEAASLWLESTAHLERATCAGYREHANLHIAPLLGEVKLSQLTVPAVRGFKDKLAKDRSPAMVRKVLTSLSSIITDAQERGLVAQNVVRGLRSIRRAKDPDHRRKGKLEVGVDIPTPDEISTIIDALKPNSRWRPLLLTAIFTGLRSSELRGLRWADADLKRGVLHVRQRADRYNQIGSLKSGTSRRTIPLPPMLTNVLREWKLACPKGELDLVFPSRRGRIEDHTTIVHCGLIPAWIAAGVIAKTGKAKYTGMHALRHFYASWCINRKQDGGLELPGKLVQARLGHASIQITLDRYGHLFPSADDGSELAAAEKALWR